MLDTTTTAIADKSISAASVKVARYCPKYVTGRPMHVEISDGLVRLTAFDGDTFVSVAVPAKMSRYGDINVDGLTLRDALKVSTSLEISGESLLVGGFTLPAVEYDHPELELGEYIGTVRGDVSWLTSATSTDQARPLLTVAQFAGTVINQTDLDMPGQGVHGVATDSYRLHRAGFGGEWRDDGVMVSRAGLTEWHRVLNDDVVVHHGTASHFRDGQRGPSTPMIVASNAGNVVATRVVDGNYPNWRQLFMSHQTSQSGTVDGKEWRAQLAIARKASDRDRLPVVLDFDSMTMTCGNYCAPMTYGGGVAGSWAFPATHLLEALPKSGQARLDLQDTNLKPIVVSSDEGIALVMPVRR